MIDIKNEIEKVMRTEFFSKMGVNDLHRENLITIESVNKVFIKPSDLDFKGLYKEAEWLPTSPTQEDPFYKISEKKRELLELRKEITKAVMNATKGMNKNNFIAAPHDFSVAARNAVCFAFRQWISEKYYNLGGKWESIVDLYYAGHWPVGYTKDKIIII